MINGKDRQHNGVALTGQGDLAGAEASDLYGDYEQQLASDLTALLKSVPGQGQALDEIASAGEAHAQRLASPPDAGHGRGNTTTAFVPAARPYNDFVDDGSSPPIPSSWREPPAAETDGAARHIKLGLAGFVSGLVLVVPVVLALTGRLDGLLGTGDSAPLPQAVAVTPAGPAVASANVMAMPQAAESQKPAQREPIAASAAPAEDPSPATERPEPAAASQPTTALLQDPSVSASAPPQDATPDGGRTQPTPVQALAERAPPASPPVDPEAELVAAGVRHIGDGDIAAARVAFSRAAASGNPEATMALAETFDPNMLAAWGARDVKADAGVARSLYAKALNAGIAKARMRLDALN